MLFTPVFIFLTLVSSTEEGHICRPPPGEEEFLAILFFAIMMTLLTTPGFQLKEAARLDGEKQRRRERGKGGLAEEDRNRGEERKEKGVPGESFSRGLGRGKNTLGNTLQEGDTGILPAG